MPKLGRTLVFVSLFFPVQAFGLSDVAFGCELGKITVSLTQRWQSEFHSGALRQLRQYAFALPVMGLPDNQSIEALLAHTSLSCLHNYRGHYQNDVSRGFTLSKLPHSRTSIVVNTAQTPQLIEQTLLHELVHAHQYALWSASLLQNQENHAAQQLFAISRHVHIEGVTTYYRSIAALKNTPSLRQMAKQHLTDFAHVTLCMEFQAYALENSLPGEEETTPSEEKTLVTLLNQHVVKRYLGREYPHSRIHQVMNHCKTSRSLNPADIYQHYLQLEMRP